MDQVFFLYLVLVLVIKVPTIVTPLDSVSFLPGTLPDIHPRDQTLTHCTTENSQNPKKSENPQ